MKKVFSGLLLISNFFVYGMDQEQEPLAHSTFDSYSDIEQAEDESKTRDELSQEFGDIKPEDCFFKAVETNNISLAKFCFKNKIGNINLRNSNEQTPLMLAVKNLNLDLVKLFLENGAKVHYVDSEGNNALHYIMPIVPINDKASGDSPKYKDEDYKQDDMMWFHSEVWTKLKGIMKLLVKAGVGIDSRDAKGNNILIRAIILNKSIKLIKFLCKNGADINLMNKDQKTAINYSTEEHRKIFDQTRDTCLVL